MSAFWENIAKNVFCDLQVYSKFSNCNYRIVVKEILLEIGFVEISFLSSIWPATRSYYSLNFGSEKIELLTIKLVYTYRVTTKCHESSIVCSIKLKNVVTRAE